MFFQEKNISINLEKSFINYLLIEFLNFYIDNLELYILSFYIIYSENWEHGAIQIKGPAGSRAGSDRSGKPLTGSDRYDRPPQIESSHVISQPIY